MVRRQKQSLMAPAEDKFIGYQKVAGLNSAGRRPWGRSWGSEFSPFPATSL
jgi:hypothetical protein